MTDIEKEIRELRRTVPALCVLVRTTDEYERSLVVVPYDGWYVHLYIREENGSVNTDRSWKGQAKTLDQAWTLAREQMMRSVN